jgi:uncharacterized membrane protein
MSAADTAGPKGQHLTQLCVLLTSFAGTKTMRANRARPVIEEALRASGGRVLDEVVFEVDPKGKAHLYDPRRTLAGLLTSALTWGLFGLAASGGSLISLVIWAALGAVAGGLYAYFTEHLLSKNQLTRIGERVGPDRSALTVWAEAADAERLLAATARLQPTTASVAAIADDLSATVFAGPGSLVESSSTGLGGGQPSSTSVLTMLFLRYPGERGAKAALEAARTAGGGGPAVELVFESDRRGKRRVSSPTTGVAAMSRSDIVSWGLFGLVWGAIVGFAGNGGILGAIESGVVTGVLWAIFGLVAGALYGLWAGRAVSAGRLKGVGPLLPADSSLILAWADGAVTERTIGALATPDAKALALRFNPVAQGALLEV